MTYTVSEESFASLASYRADPQYNLRWGTFFVLPGWMRAWWQAFGSGAELYLRAVRQGDEIIGIAPLMLRDKTARIVGDTDVCDYLDFITVPGREGDFFTALLGDLRQNGIERLELGLVRTDSAALTHLVPVAQEQKYDVSVSAEDISLEMDLPPTWEEYLEGLATKQRHEVRRKLRRLEGSGSVSYRIIENKSVDTGSTLDTFLRLFPESRGDKSAFMTARMESFFRSVADAMAEAGLLRFGVLELDGQASAMVMCFYYNECMHLYNSSYDPQYRYLSAGLLSKVLCIKNCIETGKKKFDFLKGDEKYKYHLGGKETALYSCRIAIT